MEERARGNQVWFAGSRTDSFIRNGLYGETSHFGRKASSWEYGCSYREKGKMLQAEVTGSIWGE